MQASEHNLLVQQARRDKVLRGGRKQINKSTTRKNEPHIRKLTVAPHSLQKKHSPPPAFSFTSNNRTNKGPLSWVLLSDPAAYLQYVCGGEWGVTENVWQTAVKNGLTTGDGA